MAGITTTKRSLDYVRKSGGKPWITEAWFQFPERDKVTKMPTGKTIRQRRDLYGFADLIAVYPDRQGMTLIQTTTRANQAARLGKILDSAYVEPLLKSGNRIFIHGWAQVGARGARKLWKVTVREITFVNGSMVPVLVMEDESYMEEAQRSLETSPPASLFSDEEPF